MEFSFTLIDGLIFIGVVIYLLYLYGTWTFDFFSKRHLSFRKPVPFLGNLKQTFLQKEHPIFDMNHAYTDFPGERITGFFNFTNPRYMLRDPELIKQIAVKDFDHFVDRRSLTNQDDSESNDLFGNSLFALKVSNFSIIIKENTTKIGQKWRDMRATLSPAFTGSKMKVMYTLVSDCALQMAAYLVKESKSGPLVVEMRELFTKYTNDVIATSAFGIKVDSFNEPNNEFYQMGKKISNFTGFLIIVKFISFAVFPRLMKFLKINLFNEKVSNFFRHLILDTMRTREKENIVRPDMIHLLIQARKGSLVHENQLEERDAGFATVEESTIGKQTNKRVWADDDLVAQAVLFFLAGFDTTSTLLCFAAHELAVNPDVQNILLEEIDEAKKHGTPTYDSIQKLTYLDMVVSEALRKWPPAAALDRKCTKSYVIPGLDGNPDLIIEEGKVLIIPVYAIHHDPQYYADPERFDPERFSDSNKHNVIPFTYMPFGVGPRNCIGSRFALMETKAVLFHVLSEFTFNVCSKTGVPLVLKKQAFNLTPENGFWLELKPRN